ncbi:hypothetical protein HYFRA_00003815 [Hymenoscyphus fraxineus]|uniref:AAA+ ATPase domain-containing protein n=1 Tax=Hymenoscyphus fraxineus TaxID=746836 RepID=A0A9N9L0K4_9HELO|nr:hypothetical protein HYFRA_00003815 [Hymenoscyphus fraxineus]
MTSNTGYNMGDNKDRARAYMPGSWERGSATLENITADTYDSCFDVAPISMHELPFYGVHMNELKESEAPMNHDDKSREKKTPAPSEADKILDKLMSCVGLDNVVAFFKRIKAQVETARRLGKDIPRDDLHAVFRGNPGTGKTCVAVLYADFLQALDIPPEKATSKKPRVFCETDTIQWHRVMSVEGTAAELEKNRGIFFIDNAHQILDSELSCHENLMHLLSEMENQQGDWVFIFAGHNKGLEKLFGYTPIVRHLIPNDVELDDYTDTQLHSMLKIYLRESFGEDVIVEGGILGRYTRILIRRLSKNRNSKDFGNAREVISAVRTICNRHTERITRRREMGKKSNDLWIAREDILGPEPDDVLSKSAAWKELEGMVGLEDVIASIKSLIVLAKVNRQRELQEKEPLAVTLNRLFLGGPGTGKTTVGKLYGEVLADLGLLSSSEVIMRNASDFLGQHIGESEHNTNCILDASKGKVLLIDEAYMLFTGTRNESDGADSYRLGVIDTIVARVQNIPGEDRCVILMGYTEPMMDMLRNGNPGLARRFPLEDAFHFPDFTIEQLGEILDLKCQKSDVKLSPLAREVAMQKLRLARERPNFGNGGEVENMLSRAKLSKQKRVTTNFSSNDLDFDSRNPLEPQDFDVNYQRLLSKGSDCREIFNNWVGQEEIIARFEQYQKMVEGMRMKNIDPRQHIPFAYVFKGPPGTGKTTTARKIGHIFYQMGFLSEPTVLECTATELIGKYLGQTGPKVIELLEKALGKVLFIDEAYRLTPTELHGSYQKEALSELVDSMTKIRYAGKLVIVLAGYEEEMNALLRSNQGLASRFATEIIFRPLTAEESLKLLQQSVGECGITIHTRKNGGIKLVDPVFVDPIVRNLFLALAATQSWANGRDIETLGKTLIGDTFSQFAEDPDNASMTVSYPKLVSTMQAMLELRRRRQGR